MAPGWDGVYPVTISEVKTGRSFRVRNMLTALILTILHITRREGMPSISPGEKESRVTPAGK